MLAKIMGRAADIGVRRALGANRGAMICPSGRNSQSKSVGRFGCSA
jgi:hypothetical protein